MTGSHVESMQQSQGPLPECPRRNSSDSNMNGFQQPKNHQQPPPPQSQRQLLLQQQPTTHQLLLQQQQQQQGHQHLMQPHSRQQQEQQVDIQRQQQQQLEQQQQQQQLPLPPQQQQQQHQRQQQQQHPQEQQQQQQRSPPPSPLHQAEGRSQGQKDRPASQLPSAGLLDLALDAHSCTGRLVRLLKSTGEEDGNRTVGGDARENGVLSARPTSFVPSSAPLLSTSQREEAEKLIRSAMECLVGCQCALLGLDPGSAPALLKTVANRIGAPSPRTPAAVEAGLASKSAAAAAATAAGVMATAGGEGGGRAESPGLAADCSRSDNIRPFSMPPPLLSVPRAGLPPRPLGGSPSALVALVGGGGAAGTGVAAVGEPAGTAAAGTALGRSPLGLPPRRDRPHNRSSNGSLAQRRLVRSDAAELHVKEAVELDLAPDVTLGGVLDDVLRHLNANGGGGMAGGGVGGGAGDAGGRAESKPFPSSIPGLPFPPAKGAGGSDAAADFLSGLPGLVGQLKGLTPRSFARALNQKLSGSFFSGAGGPGQAAKVLELPGKGGGVGAGQVSVAGGGGGRGSGGLDAGATSAGSGDAGLGGYVKSDMNGEGVVNGSGGGGIGSREGMGTEGLKRSYEDIDGVKSSGGGGGAGGDGGAGDSCDADGTPSKSKRPCPMPEPEGSFLPDDGWEWKKYGRKAMMGHAFPRSYFKCSLSGKNGCPAKKQAERCSDDPSKWRVRYIDQHNHPKPPPRPITVTILQDAAAHMVGGAGAAGGAAACPPAASAVSDAAASNEFGGGAFGGADGASCPQTATDRQARAIGDVSPFGASPLSLLPPPTPTSPLPLKSAADEKSPCAGGSQGMMRVGGFNPASPSSPQPHQQHQQQQQRHLQVSSSFGAGGTMGGEAESSDCIRPPALLAKPADGFNGWGGHGPQVGVQSAGGGGGGGSSAASARGVDVGGGSGGGSGMGGGGGRDGVAPADSTFGQEMGFEAWQGSGSGGAAEVGDSISFSPTYEILGIFCNEGADEEAAASMSAEPTSMEEGEGGDLWGPPTPTSQISGKYVEVPGVSAYDLIAGTVLPPPALGGGIEGNTLGTSTAADNVAGPSSALGRNAPTGGGGDSQVTAPKAADASQEGEGDDMTIVLPPRRPVHSLPPPIFSFSPRIVIGRRDPGTPSVFPMSPARPADGGSRGNSFPFLSPFANGLPLSSARVVLEFATGPLRSPSQMPDGFGF